VVPLSFPTTDAGLLAWSLNFLDLITLSPISYGLTAGDATSYGTVHASFATALAACDPPQRSKTNVATKNAARTSLKDAATLLANKVYSTATVTDAQKVELGIPPRNPPTPIPAPATSPVIEVVSMTGWTVRIRLRDSGGSSRGKPAGTIGASIFSHVGASAPTDISEYKFEGSTGRVNKIDVAFPDTLAAGTKVWLTAFWFNGRKQSGAACAPVSANLPGGSVSMAA
jgi:hypothetical protein